MLAGLARSPSSRTSQRAKLTVLKLIATSAFGLEAVVRYELSQLGYEARIVTPGRIAFDGDAEAVCRANLWLRSADRVLVEVGRFHAPDFDALFETTKSLCWEKWIPPEGRFPVAGRSRKSRLTSVPAIQRAVKRSVVDRLKDAHRAKELPETGPLYAIEVALLEDQATLTLDTTGPSLHKRGYRPFSGPAPLKETLAAALVQLSFWSPDRPLIDPFCGSGTIAIEAALLGRHIAPGLGRQFSAELWDQCPSEQWERLRQAARETIADSLPQRIVATDTDSRALKIARDAARRAGVDDDIHFQQRPVEQLTSRREYGCLITNPPYGQRLGQRAIAESLHRALPEILRKLPTWSHFILTALPDFEQRIQKKADRRRKLYNGRIQCTYYQFHGPKPGTPIARPEDSVGSETHQRTSPVRPAFGGLDEKALQQAALFRTRLVKRARHLRRWPTRQDIHCFRLYGRDVPEIPLVVDRYEDHLHIIEYERPHTRDVAQHADWLELMQRTAAQALEIDPNHVFLKRKNRQRGRSQHEKLSTKSYELTVREGGLKFWVNLSDYVDTGLFLDHRITRSIVRDAARDKHVLNLFAYTGAFSVYAADGAARSVTSVDWSASYLSWARRNFELNGFRSDVFRFVRQDARDYLAGLGQSDRFDLIVVDPPTFSNSKRSDSDWQVQQDHVELLTRALQHLADGGRIYFSSNFRQFKLREAEIPARSVREISRQTVPPDFRDRRVHRCWVIEK